MFFYWCKNLSGTCLFVGYLIAGFSLSGGVAFSAPVEMVTLELGVPGSGAGDAAKKKQPPVGDDVLPSIKLPEKLEILPPANDDHSSNGNSVTGKDGNDNSDQATSNDSTKADNFIPPQIQRDLASLPVPVAKMRELIMEAARTGRVEDLRPLIGSGENMTVLSLGIIEGDPIEFFKTVSGDEQGHEILAILLEVLEAGYVKMNPGTDSELYVWPYFFAWPLDKLTPVQKVELFRIVTAGDYEDMQSFGGYIFYRVGITPQGRWQFFVAGD